MTSAKNFGIRKRDLIGNLKTLVEDECPGQVSCADILVLAAREAVASSWGPLIKVPLGRRDSSAAPSYQLADSLIPPATTGVDEMLRIFTSKGMTVEESVAIMGKYSMKSSYTFDAHACYYYTCIYIYIYICKNIVQNPLEHVNHNFVVMMSAV
jgi:hypothetical protein